MTLFSAAEMTAIIEEFSETVVVERNTEATTDPLDGTGIPGTVLTGTLRCCVQPYDGPRRVDSTAGTDTAGNIKIWVPVGVSVMLDGDPPTDGGPLVAAPGQGGSGPSPDYIFWGSPGGQLHRYRVLEDNGWTQGQHIRYMGSDEGVG